MSEPQDACTDLSHHQDRVDFTAMVGTIRLVVLKSTEGLDTDESYTSRVALARSVGLATGAYHFLRTGQIREQAQHFLSVVQPQRGALCALDFEPETGFTLPKADEVLLWMQLVEAATGAPPLIYSTTAVLDTNVPAGHGLRRYPLWLARYPSAPGGGMAKAWSPALQIGALPKGWSADQVLLWQYTGAGRVPGVDGACDRSVGDIDAVIARYPG